jgi:hypothetical protein
VSGVVCLLVALAFLSSGCCTRNVAIPQHRLGHGVASAQFGRAVVYGPAGRVVRELNGEQARPLTALLLSGKPSPKSEPSGKRYLPISYSIAFSGDGGQRWSVQMYGKAQRAMMRVEGTYTYSSSQRRRILALVDPERRWPY